MSFEAVAQEWHANQAAVWTENYAKDVMERIAQNILPSLGNRPIAEITPPELLSVLRKIEIRGAVDQTTSALASVRYMDACGVARNRAC